MSISPRNDIQIRVRGQGGDAQLAALPVRCRIFVSYAHEDAHKDDHPRAKSLLDWFESCLDNVLPSLASRGIEPDDVFIDRNRLNGQPAWNDAIEAAIARCELVIFLVSMDSANPKRFCMREELPRAVKRGVPIIPVLLRETPEWEKKMIAGDRKPLGHYHSGGLPKTQSGDTLAILSWDNLNNAWSAVGKALAAALPDLLYPRAAPARTRTDEHLHRQLLPYLCDHREHEDAFTDAVTQWAKHEPGQGLVTLIRGRYEDGPWSFAERLLSRRLAPRALRKRGIAPPEKPVRLEWPTDPKQMLVKLIEAIDPDLGIEAEYLERVEDQAALLGRCLGAATTAKAVLVTLPEDRVSEDRLQQSFRVLVQGIASVRRDDGSLAKLWIFVIDRHGPWTWPAFETDAVRIVALDPLQRIRKGDVEDWYRDHAHLHLPLTPADCLAVFRKGSRKSLFLWLRWLVGAPVLGLQQWAEALDERLNPRQPSR